jgi:hypothetical protein
MSSDEETVFIAAKVHIKGTTHSAGYCSDPGEIKDVDTTTDEEFSVPSKQFVRDFCDSYGNVDYDGLTKLGSNGKYQLCSGSGYCGTGVRKTVTKAVLKKRRSNFKDQCLDLISSDEEEERQSVTKASTEPSQPQRFVNSFRGRINSTYTSNPSWYSNSVPNSTPSENKLSKSKFDSPEYRRRVGKIQCNRGSTCHRKNHQSRPCYYNHD